MATDTRELQILFGDAVRELRKAKLLTDSEQSQERARFDEKLSRREVTTVAETRREIEALRERLNGRRPPGTLPAKGRVGHTAKFPSDQAAKGFARAFRVNSGAYAVTVSGKTVNFKAHPSDHRLAGLERGAVAWGGTIG